MKRLIFAVILSAILSAVLATGAFAQKSELVKDLKIDTDGNGTAATLNETELTAIKALESVSNLDDLGDVSLSDPGDRDNRSLLFWNSTGGTWDDGLLQDSDIPAAIARDTELHTAATLSVAADTLFSFGGTGGQVFSLDAQAPHVVFAGPATGTAAAVPTMRTLAPTELVGGNWKLYYSNGSGQVIELALGAAGLPLLGAGVAAAPTFGGAAMAMGGYAITGLAYAQGTGGTLHLTYGTGSNNVRLSSAAGAAGDPPTNGRALNIEAGAGGAASGETTDGAGGGDVVIVPGAGGAANGGDAGDPGQVRIADPSNGAKYLSIKHDGTDSILASYAGDLNLISAGADVNVKTGATIRAWNAGNTKNVSMAHDGTNGYLSTSAGDLYSYPASGITVVKAGSANHTYLDIKANSSGKYTYQRMFNDSGGNVLSTWVAAGSNAVYTQTGAGGWFFQWAYNSGGGPMYCFTDSPEGITRTFNFDGRATGDSQIRRFTMGISSVINDAARFSGTGNLTIDQKVSIGTTAAPVGANLNVVAANSSGFAAIFSNSTGSGTIAHKGTKTLCGEVTASGTNVAMEFWNGNGTAQKGSLTWDTDSIDLTYACDSRLKTGITTATFNALTAIRKTPVSNYERLSDPTRKTQFNFVAQDIALTVPDAAYLDTNDSSASDTGTWKIKPMKLVPVLWQANRQLIKRVETLETQLAIERTRNDNQAARLAAIEKQLGINPKP